MKVLLCTITIGEGVNKICRAVAEKLTEKNVECEIFNVYENNKKRANFISKTYYKIAKTIPNLLKKIQHNISNYNRNLNRYKDYRFVKGDVKELKEILLEKINSGKYDVVYTPVQFIALSALLLRREGLINTKIIYNIPDFNIPIHTEICKDCDVIVAPCNEAVSNLVKYGFDKDKVKYIPLPVSDSNFTSLDRDKIRKDLEIPKNKFTVLMMSGGAGFGKTVKALKIFEKYADELQYIVVNGKNEKQKNEIDKLINNKQWTNIINLGFCRNVPELMTASDCLFTKVGAATMCEAYAKNLAIITTKQSLYPECDNLDHLIKYNAAKKCKNLKDCAKTFTDLKNNPNMLKEIKQNLSNVFDRDSAKHIADTVIKVSKI